MGSRPKLRQYVHDVAGHREFIAALGDGSAESRNEGNYLGQIWAVLNPTLNAIFYIIFFGLILRAGGDIGNSIAFIVIGQFMWQFMKSAVSTGGKSVSGKLGIIRALHFPRAVLPISTVYSLFRSFLWSALVMLFIVLASGAIPYYAVITPTWRWLLLPFVFVLMFFFSAGTAFITSRIVAITPDVANVINFIMRFGMFGSGVVFPITRYVHGSHFWRVVLTYQPFAVYINLARQVLMHDPLLPMRASTWIAAAFWALLFFTLGFVFFWSGEERYGRDG
jgi:teichoic acid transport system permease protein